MDREHAPVSHSHLTPVLRPIVFVAVLLFALGLRLGDFEQPYTQAGWQHMNATFAIMARNYLERGYITTKFAPVTDVGPVVGRDYQAFLHHPPLFPLLISLSFQAFGVIEWSARLVPILASLLQVVLSFLIARRLFGTAEAWLAFAITAAVPACSFYGSHVCELGAVVMAFATLAFWLTLRYLDAPSKPRLLAVCAAALLASMTDWPGVYMSGCLFLLLFAKQHRGAAIAIAASLAFLVAEHLLHHVIVTGSLRGGRGGSLAHVFAQRSYGGFDRVGGADTAALAIWRHLREHYFTPVLLAATVGLLWLRRARDVLSLIALIVASVAHTVIFPEGAARHDFWNITWAPMVAVLAASGLVAVATKLPLPACATILVVCAAGVMAWGAVRTPARFRLIEDRYCYELGRLLAAHTEPDAMILSCENSFDPLRYYANRAIAGPHRDEALARFGGTIPPEFEQSGYRYFVIPEVSFTQHRGERTPHHHEQLLSLLTGRYEQSILASQTCGNVHLFDLRKRR